MFLWEVCCYYVLNWGFVWGFAGVLRLLLFCLYVGYFGLGALKGLVDFVMSFSWEVTGLLHRLIFLFKYGSSRVLLVIQMLSLLCLCVYWISWRGSIVWVCGVGIVRGMALCGCGELFRCCSVLFWFYLR